MLGQDDEEFWDNVLAYLHLKWVLTDEGLVKRVRHQSKNFFLMDGLMWKKNHDHPPQQVVLSQDLQIRITRDAHDGSGHRGRDPTFRKIRDSYWWPNMYVSVAAYCRSCHQCQMRSTYRDTVPLQPQFVRTILRRFDADTVHMPEGRGGYKYVVDLVDNLMGWVEARAL